MPDLYEVALAYSNVQSREGMPIVVSGVAAFKGPLRELEERKLPRKHNLMSRVNRFYALQEVFNGVSPYLETHEVSVFAGTQDVRRDVQEAYIKLLRIMTKSQLYLIAGETDVITCRIIEAFDKETHKWKEVPFTDEFEKELLKYVRSKDKLVYAHDAEYYRLLDVAKVLASVEYERRKMTQGSHVLTVVSKNPTAYLQILKVTWNCPSIEVYDDFNVGPPAIVVRKSASPIVKYVYVKPGLALNVAPLAKFCRGSQNAREILTCKKSDHTHPFGQFLIGSAAEQCIYCAEGFECTKCLSRTPLCNGYDVRCRNVEFAANICCGLFALYVTRFGDELKVGTSILPNIMGRLLEQGVNSAIVFYPIEGVMNVHLLEGAVKEYLEHHVSEFEPYGIKRVFIRAPPADEKLRDFLKSWRRDDTMMLQKVSESLSEAAFKVDGNMMNFNQSEHRIVSLLSNYREPPSHLTSSYLRPKPLFNAAKGETVGYRGSFIFLDSGEVIDLRELAGYVVRGRVGEAANA